MFVYTVSEVNKFIKQIFSCEQIFYNINVKGEISNFKYHESKNMFFTLKDENSSIRCVMFKMHADLINFIPENGMFVEVCGDINIYEKNGTYQLYTTKIIEQGNGTIQHELAKLQNKLLAEGLFDNSRKKPIIKLPKVVGIVTAPGGAALQDIIKILSRRLPILKLKIFPCLVQGLSAATSIAKAIKKVSNDCEVDNVIICRGGGSKEDLNPFDDEKVCRAAFACNKPIISAIGHETDHCLLDLVADLRAPTPSAAAELVCVDTIELMMLIESRKQFIINEFKSLINKKILELKILQNRLEVVSPKKVLEGNRIKLNQFNKQIKNLIKQTLLNKKKLIEKNKIMLNILNPSNILNRGYCYAKMNNKDQKIVKSVHRTKCGDELILIFNKGKLKVKILEKQLNNNNIAT